MALTTTDPQRQIVDVTVNGALNVLRSCEKAARAGTLQRFIRTSSIAAIMDTSRPKRYDKNALVLRTHIHIHTHTHSLSLPLCLSLSLSLFIYTCTAPPPHRPGISTQKMTPT